MSRRVRHNTRIPRMTPRGKSKRPTQADSIGTGIIYVESPIEHVTTNIMNRAGSNHYSTTIQTRSNGYSTVKGTPSSHTYHDSTLKSTKNFTKSPTSLTTSISSVPSVDPTRTSTVKGTTSSHTIHDSSLKSTIYIRKSATLLTTSISSDTTRTSDMGKTMQKVAPLQPGLTIGLPVLVLIVGILASLTIGFFCYRKRMKKNSQKTSYPNPIYNKEDIAIGSDFSNLQPNISTQPPAVYETIDDHNIMKDNLNSQGQTHGYDYIQAENTKQLEHSSPEEETNTTSTADIMVENNMYERNGEMVENDMYQRNSEMVENDMYQRNSEMVDQRNSEMVENDMYQRNSEMVDQRNSAMVENDMYQRNSEMVDQRNSEMVENDMYQRNSEMVDQRNSEMVENDMYQRANEIGDHD